MICPACSGGRRGSIVSVMRLVRDDMQQPRQLTRKLYEKGIARGAGPPARIDPALLLMAAPRSAVSTTISVWPPDQPQTRISLLVTDIASGGLTAVSEAPLEDDALLTVNLSNLFGEPHHETARVIYCRPVLKQTYRISLSFESCDL